MNRGPIGAPNAHAGPRLCELRRGDKIRPSTGWRTVSHVAAVDGVVVVDTVEGETVVGKAGQRVRHAVRVENR